MVKVKILGKMPPGKMSLGKIPPGKVPPGKLLPEKLPPPLRKVFCEFSQHFLVFNNNLLVKFFYNCLFPCT